MAANTLFTHTARVHSLCCLDEPILRAVPLVHCSSSPPGGSNEDFAAFLEYQLALTSGHALPRSLPFPLFLPVSCVSACFRQKFERLICRCRRKLRSLGGKVNSFGTQPSLSTPPSPLPPIPRSALLHLPRVYQHDFEGSSIS